MLKFKETTVKGSVHVHNYQSQLQIHPHKSLVPKEFPTDFRNEEWKIIVYCSVFSLLSFSKD